MGFIVMKSKLNIKFIMAITVIVLNLIKQTLSENIQSIINSSCLIQHCQECDSDKLTCKSCKTPFKLNENGFCDASLICQENQFFVLQSGQCEQSCPLGMKENSALNICEEVDECSNTYSIGKKYLPYDITFTIFFDQSLQVYVQVSTTRFINIFDSTSLQFQAQIEASIKIQNSFYDQFRREIESWDIKSVTKKLYLKVQNLDNSKLLYFSETNKFYFISQTKNLTVIDNLTQVQKQLPYQLESTEFYGMYIQQTQTIVIAGFQLELLHLSADGKSVVFQNPYNKTLSTNVLKQFRPTVYGSNFMVFYNFDFKQIYIYYQISKKLVLANEFNVLQSGFLKDTIYQIINKTLQFYIFDKEDNLVKVGPTYPFSQYYLVPYNNYSKVIGLSSGLSIVQRFNLDFSENKKFTDQMVSQITQIDLQINYFNFYMVDQINKRLIVQESNGNIVILNLDTLKLAYNFKQFQAPPTVKTFLFQPNYITRVDTENQSNIIIDSVYSIQSINIYNGKINMRQQPPSDNLIYANSKSTQDYKIGQFKNFTFYVQKLSNFQKTNLKYPNESILSYCNKPFTSSSTNDFFTDCNQNVMLQSYKNNNQTHQPILLFALKSKQYILKEIQNHFLLCYDLECFYYSKIEFNSGIKFITGQIKITSVLAHKKQIFFVILTNNNQTATFYSYPNFQNLTTFNLPSQCNSISGDPYFEENKVIFACSQNNTSTIFFILQLSALQQNKVNCQTLQISGTPKYLIILDPKTIISFVQQNFKLYFSIYEFNKSNTKIIQKIKHYVEFNNTISQVYTDLAQRRVYFSYDSQSSQNILLSSDVNYYYLIPYTYNLIHYIENNLCMLSYFIQILYFSINQIQIWSYQYQSKYYDTIDDKDTSQILFFKTCISNKNTYGVVRINSIYILDLLKNKNYKINIQIISDIFLDSSLNIVFYLLKQSKTLYCYNYVENKLVLQQSFNSIISYFSEFIEPVFSKAFIIYNNVNNELQFCENKQISQNINCSSFKFTQNETSTIQNIISYQDILQILTMTDQYFFRVDPTQSPQFILSYNSTTSTTKIRLYPNTGLILSQRISNLQESISNKYFSPQYAISINCIVNDLILANNGYFAICLKDIVKVNKFYLTEFQISITMQIKKLLYYNKQNILVFISPDLDYCQYLLFYDILTQHQLQSIKISDYPLENIIYISDEDIFIVYNVEGKIFRVDLNKNTDEQIVDSLEIDSAIQNNNFIPQIYFNKIMNKIFISFPTYFFMWNMSPLIGERFNFQSIRLNFKAVQNQKNKNLIYYADFNKYIWQFNISKQIFIELAPSILIELYTMIDYLVIFYLNHIQIYQIKDESNILLNQINLAYSIQMTIQYNASTFCFTNDLFELYFFDLASNPKSLPIKFQQLQQTPQDIILVTNDTILITLLNQAPVKYKLNDSNFQVLESIPNLKTFIGQMFIPFDNSIIIIEEKYIIKLDSKNFSVIKYINFPDMDQAGYIESFQFDMVQNLLYIHYSLQSYVFIIDFNLNKQSMKQIGCCALYKVQILITDFYVAIYCQFQINFHERNSELTYLYSFREPLQVKSMYDLIILNDTYLVALQLNQISIFSMSPMVQNTRTFTLYRTIYSSMPKIFQCFINNQNQIKIYGVGNEGSFHYILQFNTTCQNKFSEIKNLLGLRSQINQFNQAEIDIQNKYFYFDIELDQNTNFTKLPYINDLQLKKNNAQITYIPQKQNQKLALNNESFLDVQLQDFILKNFTFNIQKDSDNITFNPKTQTITLKKIIISNDLENISIKFQNVKKVLIDQLNITNLNIINSNIFYSQGIEQIYFTNIYITNVKFTNSSLIQIKDSKSIIFNQIFIEQVELSQESNLLINICNSNNFKLSFFKIKDINYNLITNTKISDNEQVIEHSNEYLQQQLNHIVQIQKVDKVLIEKGQCNNLNNISMIKIEKFYSDKHLLLQLEDSEVVIQLIKFEDNRSINSIVYIRASYVQLYNISGYQNKCTDCNGSVFTIIETKKFTIDNSQFQSNNAIHGGSISHIKCLDNQNFIINSTFTFNSARGNGGAIYLQNCNLNLLNSNFADNIALIGGAIRYKDQVPDFIHYLNDPHQNISFKNNQAQYYGNNYGSYFGQIIVDDLDNLILKNNISDKNITNDQLYINEFSSGSYVELSVKILDEEQQVIKFNPKEISLSSQIPKSIQNEIQQITFNLVTQKESILIEGSDFATFQYFDQQSSSYKFPKIRLISRPNDLGKFQVKTNTEFGIPFYVFEKYEKTLYEDQFISQSNLNSEMLSQIEKKQYAIDIIISFRECQRGEIYQNISLTKVTCLKCPLGSYSLVEPDYFKKQECIQCSSHNTKECANNTIILEDGFWRLNKFSDTILECLNRKENCQDNVSSKQYCTEGLIGPLCESCDYKGVVWGQPYSNTLDYQCAPCNNHFQKYVRLMLIFIGINLYILGSYKIFCLLFIEKAIVYYLRITRIICFGNTTRRDQSSSYLKFLIIYSQLQSNINQLSQIVFFQPLNYILSSPISSLNSSIDCQISQFQNQRYFKVLIMTILPLIIYFWICTIFLIKSIINKRNQYINKIKLSSLFLFTFTVFQQNSVSFMIQTISCRQIGDVRYVDFDTSMLCYCNDHILIIILSIVGLFFWVVVMPIYIYKKLIKLENLHWITVQYRYGFFYIEYKKSKIYWDLIRIYLKLFIILFVNIFKEFPTTQFVCLTITLFIYYNSLFYYSPYEINYMNKVDKFLISSLCTQVLLNALIKDLNGFIYLQYIFKIVCIIINGSTFVFLILTILSQKIIFIRNNIQKIKFSLSKFKYLKRLKFLKLNDFVSSSTKRFNLWKKLIKNLQVAVIECQKMKYIQLHDSYIQKEQSTRILQKLRSQSVIKRSSLKGNSTSLDMDQPSFQYNIINSLAKVDNQYYLDDTQNELFANKYKNQIVHNNQMQESFSQLQNINSNQLIQNQISMCKIQNESFERRPSFSPLLGSPEDLKPRFTQIVEKFDKNQRKKYKRESISKIEDINSEDQSSNCLQDQKLTKTNNDDSPQMRNILSNYELSILQRQISIENKIIDQDQQNTQITVNDQNNQNRISKSLKEENSSKIWEKDVFMKKTQSYKVLQKSLDNEFSNQQQINDSNQSISINEQSMKLDDAQI